MSVKLLCEFPPAQCVWDVLSGIISGPKMSHVGEFRAPTFFHGYRPWPRNLPIGFATPSFESTEARLTISGHPPLHCSTIQYTTMQYCMYRTTQHCTVHYSTVQYSTIQYNTGQYATVERSTVRCSGRYRTTQCTSQNTTVQHGALQYSTGQYSTTALKHYVAF